MPELDFAIDVAEPTPAPTAPTAPTAATDSARTRPLLALGLLGALASAALVLPQNAPVSPTPGRQPPVVAAVAEVPAAPTVAADVVEETPAPAAPLPARPRIERKAVRAMVSQHGFVDALKDIAATRPSVREKVAARVSAPRGETLVVATLDKSDIDFVMRDRANAFRACYERGLKEDASFKSALDIHFTIGAQGDVRAARVKPKEVSAQSTKLARCVKAVVQRAAFGPTGSGPLTVSRTLVFQPGTSS